MQIVDEVLAAMGPGVCLRKVEAESEGEGEAEGMGETRMEGTAETRMWGKGECKELALEVAVVEVGKAEKMEGETWGGAQVQGQQRKCTPIHWDMVQACSGPRSET